MVENFGAARDHGVAAPTQAVCRPLHAQGPARSVLKMKRVDPSHLCISATVGLVMPAGLEGMAIGIGGKVGPCTRVVDQFWIRSAIDSHGSAPDRMSRAVPSL
ncbi:MAG: hypothetical protein H7Z19_17255 [Chitinophagaceae bacterium]|nr:hypothetical protein [Rubrivivax sp.]